MWAAAIPAAIGAVASLFGGRKREKSQEEANAQNLQAQREFAQMGLQWKVADAKAAGLHPLFGIAGTGAAFSPSFRAGEDGGGWSEAGQHVARAAEAVMPEARELRAAQLDAVKASAAKDYAIAAAADSEAARLRGSPAPTAEAFAIADPRHRLSNDLIVDGQPNSRLAVGSPLGPWQPLPGYVTGDVNPGFERYQTPFGEVLLPAAGGQMSQAVESVAESPVILAAIYAANLKHYGTKDGARIKNALKSLIPKGVFE